MDRPAEPLPPSPPPFPSPREEFAAELTRLREKSDLTVRAVAARVAAPGAHTTIGGWFAGQSLPSMGSLPLFRRLLAELGVVDAAEAERWLERLADLRRDRFRRTAGGVLPYRGLAGFEEHHADWFFGRDRLRDTVVERLTADGAAVAHLLVGPSGSGKSSLMRAGVLPALRADHGFLPVLLTPGPTPLASLAKALRTATGEADRVPEGTDPQALAAYAHDWTERGGARLLVAVDQLEEVFTSCRRADDREAFLSCLAALPSPHAVRVLGALRADFYSHALQEPLLGPALQHGQIVVGALTDEDIRSAVHGPAGKAGLAVDPGFADLLVADLRHSGAGGLPLLSHALLSTWERGRGTVLTIADYRAGGGISAAVSASAEEAYAGLTEPQRLMARVLFLRMVAVGDGEPDARRLLPLPGPPEQTPYEGDVREPGGAGPSEVHGVLEWFVDRRLVTLDGDGARIAHEALLTAWPRLHGWIESDRAGLLVWQELSRDAERWQTRGREPSLLYGGTRLALADRWARTSGRNDELTRTEKEFLAAGVAAEDSRARRERRHTRRLRQLLGLLTVLATVAGALAAVAVVQRSDANAVAYDARGQWLATGSADNQVRLHDAGTRDVAAVFPHPGPVTSTAFLPDGTGLVTGCADGTVRIWRLPPRPLRGVQGTVNAVAYSPDGTLLAVAGREVRLWDVRDPWQPRPAGPPLGNPTGYSGTLSFTPDGRTLAVGGREGKVWLWDVSRPAAPAPLGEPLAGGTGTIQSAVFSPDGSTLAVGSEGRTVRLWDTREPARPRPTAELAEPTNYVYSVAFSPDGHRLAAGTVDRQVLLWRIPEGGGAPRHEATLRGPGSYVMSVAFSPDGHTLAAGTGDRDVWRWRVDGPGPVSTGAPLTGPSSYVYALSYAPDGRTLAAASTDGTVWLWDSPSTDRKQREEPQPQPRAVLGGLGGKGYAVAYAPDGHRLAAGGSGPAAVVWATDEEEVARRLCERAGSPITRAEWTSLLPGLPYAPPCG